ncbi:hypothetical protein AYI69_g2507 [Smittium culicis]|uniref:Uncharacterized protein n=1 Tax=Smittium culicis TaxID=133412 RepID=A0A1R1YMB8_9FUNG|nr:hypothetical protein AYI69_g2507 [Smittium culicis]
MKKPAEKKPDDKKPDDKAPGDKKPDDKAPDDKKPDDKAPGDKKPEDINSGMGLFSFLYYLFIFGFIIYFVVGCVYNSMINNETGLNMIPNRG